ncbi:MAG TPA: 2Fe-2S iron-sulfur cluster-binding protein [Candidatus Binatia bacterium]
MVDRLFKKAVLRVRRGTASENCRYDNFEVPFEEGMSVLDALRWIRVNLDSTLAIRYSCINANACKTCMALVNGAVEYTCIAKLIPGTMTVEPLPKRPLIRDLVTDILPEEEKLSQAVEKDSAQCLGIEDRE